MTRAILLLVLGVSTAAWANGFVGNGGDGVIVGNNTVVRDLYEQGVTQPWIGAGLNFDTLSALNRIEIPEQLGIDRALLARKLNDLDGVLPELQYFAILALQQYHVIAIPNALPLLPSDSPASEARVQLALRVYRDIRISTPEFIKLSPEQKTALLIHEILYSLLRPKCQAGLCEQVSREIRDIVGRLFKKSSLGDKTLASDIENRLALPARSGVCAAKSLLLQVQVWPRVGDEQIPVGPARSSSADYPEQCHSLVGLDHNFVSADATYVSLEPGIDVYPATSGTQQAIRIIPWVRHLKSFWNDQSDLSCMANFSSTLKDWQGLAAPLENYCR